MAYKHQYRLMQETMQIVEELTTQPETRGCIQWIDDYFDGAWTKALERLDDAFHRSLKLDEPRIAEAEAAVYLNTLRYFVQRYREVHNGSRAAAILQLAGMAQSPVPDAPALRPQVHGVRGDARAGSDSPGGPHHSNLEPAGPGAGAEQPSGALPGVQPREVESVGGGLPPIWEEPW
jgi:hypothetical protein